MIITKQIIFGDGIDSATVWIRGTENEVVEFTVNAVAYTATADVKTGLEGEYLANVEITSDTPNLTIVVSHASESVVIYSIGLP